MAKSPLPLLLGAAAILLMRRRSGGTPSSKPADKPADKPAEAAPGMDDYPKLHVLKDVVEFNDLFYDGPKYFFVDFTAKWCDPCQKLIPYLQKFAQTYKDKAGFYQIDIDASPDVASEYEIDGVPTVLAFKDESVYNVLEGWDGPEALEEFIRDTLRDVL